MRRLPAVLFAMVCLLSGSFWLLPDTTPGIADDLAILALGGLVAALATAFLYAPTGSEPLLTQGWNWRLVLSGVGALGAPAVLLLLGRQQFSSVMAVAVQAGVPVVVAIASGVLAAGSDLQQGMVPGLTALAGALLVLPVALPASPGGWIGFSLYLAAALLAGVCGVLCHREMGCVPPRRAVCTVLLANAVFLCATAAGWLTIAGEWHDLKGAGTAPDWIAAVVTGIDAAGIVGLLLLLRPLTTSTRFIFVPVLSTLEAYVLLRPTVSTRTGLGILLMVGGGLACLQADRQEPDSAKMSLR